MSYTAQRRGWVLDVAQLAELDMAAHGRKLIIGEFAVGVAGCAFLGAISLRSGLLALNHGPGWQLWLGVELIFVGLNYLPLLLVALDAASDEVRMQRATRVLTEQTHIARRVGLLQSWILVPMAVVAFALDQRLRTH